MRAEEHFLNSYFVTNSTMVAQPHGAGLVLVFWVSLSRWRHVIHQSVVC